MKELDKWWEKNGEFTCSPAMHFDKRDAKRVWKAALEWVLKNRKPYYSIEDKKVVAIDSNILYKELEKD